MAKKIENWREQIRSGVAPSEVIAGFLEKRGYDQLPQDEVVRAHESELIRWKRMKEREDLDGLKSELDENCYIASRMIEGGGYRGGLSRIHWNVNALRSVLEDD